MTKGCFRGRGQRGRCMPGPERAQGYLKLKNGRTLTREHESALGRIKIEADDLRGLGDEIGIVALTPGLPPVEVDLLGPQEAPDILVR
jgi:hypothetical protein